MAFPVLRLISFVVFCIFSRSAGAKYNGDLFLFAKYGEVGAGFQSYFGVRNILKVDWVVV